MKTNHQMNYYDYAKTLSAEGVMTALIGGGAGPEPTLPTEGTVTYLQTGAYSANCRLYFNDELPEGATIVETKLKNGDTLIFTIIGWYLLNGVWTSGTGVIEDIGYETKAETTISVDGNNYVINGSVSF